MLSEMTSARISSSLISGSSNSSSTQIVRAIQAQRLGFHGMINFLSNYIITLQGFDFHLAAAARRTGIHGGGLRARAQVTVAALTAMARRQVSIEGHARFSTPWHRVAIMLSPAPTVLSTGTFSPLPRSV